VILAVAVAPAAETFYTYVGWIEPDSVLLAWGTAEGKGNTIGFESASHGPAIVRIGGKEIQENHRNWVDVRGLQPDTTYPYEISVKGRVAGKGSVRTHPLQSRRLAFFVIGDFGDASKAQRRIAAAMAAEFEKRRQSDNPVRFVLTTGDDIYADTVLGIPVRNSGDEDRDWRTKFFGPYQPILRHIPFYATPGNHDGNASESRGDLDVYLDNFFFPGNHPGRYYMFSYGGGLANFFALDSTENTEVGPPSPYYYEDGVQSLWLKQMLDRSQPVHAPPAAWNIAYFHHPLYSAGPRHEPMLNELLHWQRWFEAGGVQVVFNGHEHNFQVSDASRTVGIRYFVTGAGGQLRPSNIRARLYDARIVGWAPQNHFLLVEIDNDVMRVTPLADEPVVPVTAEGPPLPLPIKVQVQIKRRPQPVTQDAAGAPR